MKNPNLLLKSYWFLYHKKIVIKGHPSKTTAGFTLIELFVVVILMGVIAAIAAPGWLSFVEQRRVNKANDVVLGALRQAQSEAKKTKLSYSVSFRNTSGVPEIAVYPSQKPDPNNPGQFINVNPSKDLSSSSWKSLGQDLELKRGQVLLGTNIASENKTATAVSYNPDPSNQKITFDYTGTLPTTADTNLTVVVSMPKGNSTTEVVDSLKRCVKVTTLLGTITTGRGSNSNNNSEGCP